MKIKLIVIGKTDSKELSKLIDIYFKRIKQFVDFEFVIIQDVKKIKNISINELKLRESRELLKKINKNDYIIILDEKGKEFTSLEFSTFLQKKMNMGIKNLVFIIGGAYGFSKEIYERANQELSLSRMTFSHQLIRVIFAEQLFRAYAILNNHPYHNY